MEPRSASRLLTGAKRQIEQDGVKVEKTIFSTGPLDQKSGSWVSGGLRALYDINQQCKALDKTLFPLIESIRRTEKIVLRRAQVTLGL